MERTRKCSKCNDEKPLESFSKMVNGREGKRSQCKECDRLDASKKGLRVPTERSKYTLNKTTMMNHMYIHFGFWESTKTQVERDQQRRDLRKYYKEEQSDKLK